jgi:hypothetical protein
MEKITDLASHTEFLVRFGFLGVAIFVMLVIAPFVHRLLASRTATTATLLVGGLFLFLFAATDFIRATFPNVLPQPVGMFKGMVRGVSISVGVALKADLPDEDDGRPFMKWEHDRAERDLKNYPFVFLANEAPRCITISLQDDAQGSVNIGGEPSIFNLPIPGELQWGGQNTLYVRSIAADGRMRIEYSVRPRHGPAPKRFHADPAGDDEASCQQPERTARSFRGLISSAFAQQRPLDLETVKSRLQHSDAIVRRDMRVQLSRQGAASFSTILPLLQSGDYRLQIGALAAIAAMPPDVRARLPGAARSAATALLSHPDRTMRDTARRALDSQ